MAQIELAKLSSSGDSSCVRGYPRHLTLYDLAAAAALRFLASDTPPLTGVPASLLLVMLELLLALLLAIIVPHEHSPPKNKECGKKKKKINRCYCGKDRQLATIMTPP